ncbi:unnamed protein product [Ranitomeya imitator]|uniref:Uncharacterized protein n=1 Tax=Ranitomeya imitator TaxID=111125 RepID=A0ABN9M8Y2_9NEOB|nr:unnamed protein product [Ranitomeya imitator]
MQSIPEMTDYIKNFSLKDCNKKGFSRVLLQLFGYLGHGKSSFINTCKYVLDDTEFKPYADVKNNDGGNTTERITYELTDTLTLVDNRGCSIMNEYETGEIFAQLGNLLPLNKQVAWSKGIGLVDRIIQAERSVQTSDFIYPIFVYRSVDDIRTNGMTKNTIQILNSFYPGYRHVGRWKKLSVYSPPAPKSDLQRSDRCLDPAASFSVKGP